MTLKKQYSDRIIYIPNVTVFKTDNDIFCKTSIQFYKKNSEEFYQNLITLGQEGNTAPIFFDAVPFIFNCNLDILIYRTNDGSSAIEKIEYRKEKLAESEYEINLIFREKDFDIFYKDYFYNKY